MFAELLWLIGAIIIVGVLVWAIDNLPAIDAMFKQVARIVLIVALVIYAVVVIIGIITGAPVGPRLRG
jgi:hypothetical protein